MALFAAAFELILVPEFLRVATLVSTFAEVPYGAVYGVGMRVVERLTVASSATVEIDDVARRLDLASVHTEDLELARSLAFVAHVVVVVHVKGALGTHSSIAVGAFATTANLFAVVPARLFFPSVREVSLAGACGVARLEPHFSVPR